MLISLSILLIFIIRASNQPSLSYLNIFISLLRYPPELYYGGEGVSIEQPQSLTCPYCSRMGFTETTLQEHVAADHADASVEVVSNLIYYDFTILLGTTHFQNKRIVEPIGALYHKSITFRCPNVSLTFHWITFAAYHIYSSLNR
jgi:hypothetical protein